MRSGRPARSRRPHGIGRTASGVGAVLVGLLATALAGPAAAASITGVCPDGSVYIVRSEAAVPCRDSKRVDPHDVPPMRPEYLPRPYTWEVYREGADPNNPYNLIDSAEKVRALRDERTGDGAESAREVAAGRPAPSVAPAAVTGPVELGLAGGELRDLFELVTLSQQVAPASFVQETADGREALRVELAWSAAFESRVQQTSRAAGRDTAGPVLLVTAVARQPSRFGAFLTFVQGHLAFQPEAGDPDQLAVVQGHLGDLDAGEAVLAYVILPAAMDLSAPLDVYFHDRHETVVFRR